ncbi:nitrilase super family protein, partial [Candidatus Termititenax persephonae]
AENLLILSSSPYREGIQAKWQAINQTLAGHFAMNVIYCNRVGIEDGVTFWGGSAVYTNDGQLLGRAAELEPQILTVNLHLNPGVRAKSVFVRDERPDVVLKELGIIWKQRL